MLRQLKYVKLKTTQLVQLYQVITKELIRIDELETAGLLVESFPEELKG